MMLQSLFSHCNCEKINLLQLLEQNNNITFTSVSGLLCYTYWLCSHSEENVELLLGIVSEEISKNSTASLINVQSVTLQYINEPRDWGVSKRFVSERYNVML